MLTDFAFEVKLLYSESNKNRETRGFYYSLMTPHLHSSSPTTATSSPGGSNMASATIDISEARRHFTRLDERLLKDRMIWVTRHNKKAFAVVDVDYIQAVLETLEILKDPKTAQYLVDSLKEIKSCALIDHEDLKSELMDEHTI
jgi:PHD/YefM family antitoxin component YafN of YafNO toxin-antitoxin module